MDASVCDWQRPAPVPAPRLCQPGDAAQALALRRQPGAAYIAGGTALQLSWGVAEEERPDVRLLVDLLAGAVPAGVAEARLPDGRPALWLGAGTRLEALRGEPAVRAAAPRLAEALDAVAAPGVRHLATLGGNIGWRWGDTLPALLAADAWAVPADQAPLPMAQLPAQTPLLVAVLWPLVRHQPEGPDRPDGLDGPEGPDRGPADGLGGSDRPAMPQAPERASALGWSVFDKQGWRAAFSPSRLTLALEVGLCAGQLDRPRLAATAAGWPARRLHAAEAWLQGRAPDDLGASPGGGLRQACLSDLEDPGRARLAARLIAGHLSAPPARRGPVAHG